MEEMPLEINEQGLISFTQELIRTPSLSFEEEKVARLVVDRMRQVGFDHVTLDELFNVVGNLFGEAPSPELLFNGHIDHVPPSHIAEPYSGRIVPGDK